MKDETIFMHYKTRKGFERRKDVKEGYGKKNYKKRKKNSKLRKKKGLEK